MEPKEKENFIIKGSFIRLFVHSFLSNLGERYPQLEGKLYSWPYVHILHTVSLLHSSFLSKEAAPATTR